MPQKVDMRPEACCLPLSRYYNSSLLKNIWSLNDVFYNSSFAVLLDVFGVSCFVLGSSLCLKFRSTCSCWLILCIKLFHTCSSPIGVVSTLISNHICYTKDCTFLSVFTHLQQLPVQTHSVGFSSEFSSLSKFTILTALCHAKKYLSLSLY